MAATAPSLSDRGEWPTVPEVRGRILVAVAITQPKVRLSSSNLPTLDAADVYAVGGKQTANCIRVGVTVH